MDRLHFDFFGLRVTLDTPVALSVSKRLQPFLCSPDESGADCSICIKICQTLPQPKGVWHGPECYCRTSDMLQTFHCQEKQGAPFAMTCMDGKGNVQIAVLPGYADYFSGSSGVFNRIGLENMLLQHDGLLLHASLIDYAGKGIVFTGPSGAGKSTQAELWRKYLGAQVLNGDKAALRKTASDWTAYGSPYAGTSGIYKNKNVPLVAIVVLRQAKENRLRPIAFSEAFPYIWPELSLRRWDETAVTQAMDLCGKLLADIPVYVLECLPEESAVMALKKGLSL